MKNLVIVDVNRTPKKTFVVSNKHAVFVIIARFPKVKEATYRISLRGKGAHAMIIGLIMGSKNDFILHTLQEHKAPETTSDLLVKAVLLDNARFSYDGVIRVEKRAQKTDAYQRNENLLLSDSSFARSDPTLEILANDVRCTHGATIGKISEDELWYLASRGISNTMGRKLIAEGFLESAIMRISDTIAAQSIRKRLWMTL
ncbi:MAG: hypothetical protein ACD_48C00471G0003 [uncultured bacterium]|uniref:SUF system FeS cluster assembly SufBD core domain-containing protein n=1 Tax=Candidatus Gottesmanbacteria bacterium RIFCSPLOWO2_01_FULL_43_11b TaxID=1798392 RepID=A0A1F6AIB4_9BACT|nr:MAG: hypothetical protein ACD_48C00471G0003 [uncultured bacterium]OGG24356.1 MAG: hypothetical protein A3A79_04190 [Candidatus Gottesmanbacteria bacterium RIFCSPLOWO2_01_FULL_43_11b]